MDMRTGVFLHNFCQKRSFLCIILVFDQNCNIISAYFLYFSRFANPVYNGITTHSIDVPHNTIMRAGWFWTIFEKKTICLVILSFLKQNFDNIPVYLFLSFTSQVYNSIPIHFIDFPHMTMRGLLFWHFFCRKRPSVLKFCRCPTKITIVYLPWFAHFCCF